jgi:rhomboid domain-containing protein 1
MRSSASSYLGTIPATTKLLVAVCVVVHIFIFLTSFPLNNVAINGYLVLYQHEYYRIVSAAFVHGGIMHIAMNMSSLIQLGSTLEVKFGSLNFLLYSIWSVLLVGFVYVIISYVLSIALQDPTKLYESGVGYSGVLFSYAIIDSYHTTDTVRSVFGLFTVPAKIHPFILLILIQVILPNISFMGHVSGVLIGLLTVAGSIQILLPSIECLHLLERNYPFYALTKLAPYIASTNTTFQHHSCRGISYVSIFMTVLTYMYHFIVHVVNFISVLLYAILPASWTEFLRSTWPAIYTSFMSLLQSVYNRTTPSSSTAEEEGVVMSTIHSSPDGRGIYVQASTIDVESPQKPTVIM